MATRRGDLRRQLDALAFGQAGYFSASQALQLGFSYQAQKYHVDVGNWQRVDRGLFRLTGWPSQPEDEYIRWTLWSKGQGVFSHETALRVHGLSDVDPVKIHLTVPSSFHAKDPVVVTHKDALAAEDVQSRGAWKVTSPVRTLVDAAAGGLSQEVVTGAMLDAIERGLVTRRAVSRRAADCAPRAALRLERALARAVELA